MKQQHRHSAGWTTDLMPLDPTRRRAIGVTDRRFVAATRDMTITAATAAACTLSLIQRTQAKARGRQSKNNGVGLLEMKASRDWATHYLPSSDRGQLQRSTHRLRPVCFSRPASFAIVCQSVCLLARQRRGRSAQRPTQLGQW